MASKSTISLLTFDEAYIFLASQMIIDATRRNADFKGSDDFMMKLFLLNTSNAADNTRARNYIKPSR